MSKRRDVGDGVLPRVVYVLRHEPDVDEDKVDGEVRLEWELVRQDASGGLNYSSVRSARVPIPEELPLSGIRDAERTLASS